MNTTCDVKIDDLIIPIDEFKGIRNQVFIKSPRDIYKLLLIL